MTSATGGYLAPTPLPSPLYGQELENFFQQWVVGVTALDPTSVRPRWQLEPPNEPAPNADWCAVGAFRFDSPNYPTELHSASGDGSSVVYRQEDISLLLSFYGPNALRFASVFREGAGVAQNREPLSVAGMGLKSIGELHNVPSLKNDRWQNRVDVGVVVTREIVRKYEVFNLVSAEGEIVTDNDPPLEQPINVQE